MKNFTSKQQQVILGIIFCLLFIFLFKFSTLNNLFFPTIPENVIKRNHPLITMELMGEVEKPGIYCFEHEVNVGEVIERAGGLKNNVILIQGHLSTEVSNGAAITIGSDPSSFMMEVMDPEKRLLYFIPINLNTASLEELVVIPGIGEKTARAIIHHRQEYGNFSRLDELKEVSGIGHYKLKRMKRYLKF